MARPKVSVVVPIYKVEKYLVQCLESIVHQTLSEIEIILLDDGEQDRCREIIDFYEQADPRIIAVHEPCPAFSYGAKVNKGLDRATGEFVSIVEPDDFIDLDMYAEMYACAVRTGANIVKTPYYDYFSAKKHTVAKSRAYINQNIPAEKPFSIFQFPQLIAMHPSFWSAIYRTDVLNERRVRAVEAPGAGYVDNRFYLDAYVAMGGIVWLDHPFYHWRQTSVTSSSTAQNWNRGVMLTRWNEILSAYPPDEDPYRVFGAFFAYKAWVTIFRHYQEGWTFNEEEYAELTAFLKRIPEEQLRAAERMKPEQIEQMLACRNDPEGYKPVLIRTLEENRQNAAAAAQAKAAPEKDKKPAASKPATAQKKEQAPKASAQETEKPKTGEKEPAKTAEKPQAEKKLSADEGNKQTPEPAVKKTQPEPAKAPAKAPEKAVSAKQPQSGFSLAAAKLGGDGCRRIALGIGIYCYLILAGMETSFLKDALSDGVRAALSTGAVVFFVAALALFLVHAVFWAAGKGKKPARANAKTGAKEAAKGSEGANKAK